MRKNELPIHGPRQALAIRLGFEEDSNENENLLGCGLDHGRDGPRTGAGDLRGGFHFGGRLTAAGWRVKTYLFEDFEFVGGCYKHYRLIGLYPSTGRIDLFNNKTDLHKPRKGIVRDLAL
jgi:hypothetical protein